MVLDVKVFFNWCENFRRNPSISNHCRWYQTYYPIENKYLAKIINFVIQKSGAEMSFTVEK